MRFSSCKWYFLQIILRWRNKYSTIKTISVNWFFIAGSISVLCDVWAGGRLWNSWKLRPHHLLLQVKVKMRRQNGPKLSFYHIIPRPKSGLLSPLLSFSKGHTLSISRSILRVFLNCFQVLNCSKFENIYVDVNRPCIILWQYWSSHQDMKDIRKKPFFFFCIIFKERIRTKQLHQWEHSLLRLVFAKAKFKIGLYAVGCQLKKYPQTFACLADYKTVLGNNIIASPTISKYRVIFSLVPKVKVWKT